MAPPTINLWITLAASQTWSFSIEVNGSTGMTFPARVDVNGKNWVLTRQPGYGGLTVALGPICDSAGVCGDSSLTGPGSINAGPESVLSSLDTSAAVSGSAVLGGGRIGSLSAGIIGKCIGGCNLNTGNISLSSYKPALTTTPSTSYRLTARGSVNVNGAFFDPSIPQSPQQIPVGTNIVVIDNDGTDPVIGTFQTWRTCDRYEGPTFSLTEGAVMCVWVGPLQDQLRISYTGATGNDIVLTAIGPYYENTTTTLTTTSPDPSSYGQTIALTARVSNNPLAVPYGAPTGSIVFRDGGVAIGSAPLVAESSSAAVATLMTSALGVGQHSITAEFSFDGKYQASTSAPLARTVLAAGPETARADLNRDGHDDLIWAHNVTREVVAWYMNGTSRVGSAGLASPESVDWNVVGTGDFDQNGYVDLLWQNLATGDVAIWLMMDTVHMDTVFLGPAPLDWKIVGVGDFNDGKPDIVWRSTSSGAVNVWFMNGTAYTNSGATIAAVPNSWRLEVVGDFDGNGTSDFIWRSTTTGEINLWLMSGTTFQQSVNLGTVGDQNWRIVATGDYNGDGSLDLVWRHSTTGANVVWYLKNLQVIGNGVFPAVLDNDWVIVGPR